MSFSYKDLIDFRDVHKNLLFVCICLIIVFLLILISNFLSSNASLQKSNVKLSNLVRKAVKIHNMAKDSTDTSFILQQSTEALAYISIARQMGNEDMLTQRTDVNIIQLEKELLEMQIDAAYNLRGSVQASTKYMY
jgi:hypothetical protein